ncbi:MAG TPA: type II secretion system protein [Candidatus Chromulinivoraceae bacterium]|nr:type II secretion system protein [Candidatus Chromulinivoraceae bacterium]
MNHRKQNGFTLIELMLAMTFISVLLVAVAMTTIQIGNIYNKGITLREVDQAGRAVTTELQQSIASSVPFDVTPKVDNSPATATSKYVMLPGGGRLCLGNYSYAWNYGSALAGGPGAPALYNKYDDNTPVHFAKVADAGGALCSNMNTTVTRLDATEILTTGDRDLVVHAFSIAQTASDASTSQAIYAISMVIGTNDRQQLTTDNTSCKPPAAGVGDQDYCSVNRFDIIARAGNKSGGQ